MEVLDGSAEAAGLRRTAWERQAGGDGELAVLPADEPENLLVDNFVRELDGRLADHNEDRLPEARLRLRLALHHGIVEPAANGFAGAGVVVVSRLVESAAIRATQAAVPEAHLVVILSNRIFLDTVAQGHTVLRPANCRKVQVQVKEYAEAAWIYVPGHEAHGLVLTVPQSAEPASVEARPPGDADGTGQAPPTYSAEVISQFHGPVTANVIGINKGGSNG
ncbi:hypothetical protein [Catellatospora sp. NPDC049133]|jgi:hypothetical protein|uniref:hypothetical protein n=1 Tax=Catellatospora sp. NPDC049133 TaxID=3155499 RepID=UPI0033CA42D7